ncbi:MdtA/MuxA family multidrug efflux RND transporter periplasmic adaptor subunit [Rhodoferax sp.]|uniref:MdtA/MuxA family multidrug efflux RND transporter periplasmic adaptor subunit n=1 Tax=Rhodoferax sp. TaxID=50421 RepID=UPI0025DDB5C4|nr:MdtA/MuxA family multidrug efflux RND transporter periplasmic adaptor subunit [Rhodoferax sp.]
MTQRTFIRTQTGLSGPGYLGLVLLVAAAGGGGWWWGQHHSAADASAVAAPAKSASAPGGGAAGGRRFGGASNVQPVSVAAVQQHDVRVLVSAIGNISALNTAVVRAQVAGVLQAVRFTEGQQVKAGQVLAEIDPRSFQVALSQAQGSLARDQAQLRNAQLDLARYQDLLAKDSIAKQQVDTQDALVKQLQGTVLTDQAQVDSAKLQLSYTQVRAPIGGRLGFRQVDVGNMVQTSDVNGLVSITQTQPLNVVFAVPEANVAQITQKLAAKTPLVVEAWDRALKNKLAVGKVTSTDNAIDTTTGTLKLKAQFANADSALFPNQFVNVVLQLGTLQSAMVVPSAAVQRGAQGTYVYAVKDDGSVTVRRIQLGATDGDGVSVRGDISVGEKVVTDGADRLREGAKVEIIAAPAADTGKRQKSETNTAPAQAVSAPAATKSEAPAATQKTAPASEATAEERPRWLDRLPQEEQDKFLKMSPDERKAFIEQRREQRRQKEASGS